MNPAQHIKRGPRWRPTVCAFTTGLLTITLSLFMLHVFSRTTTLPANANAPPQHTTPTETNIHIDEHPTPTPTHTPTVADSPDSVQETGFFLNPHDHIARAPKTQRMTWNITREIRQPDGVEKEIYLINGMSCSPAPLRHPT
ncbi:hypothetical protein NQ176_g11386 [Zarea fungicola]|uniref:Uncharacterized protein n=1 Tax=Zarea fungicola TaxID=93591 RepID=A0ACC1MBI3_9HYPO|nr:hypothetical protein NQ176_g11386 [Lecanicillium fungicola]